ncbi:AGC family protein kinase [Trichomonas vaginalis G3]|uniref:AGC family protein kinase n=1 Tax=Trichomonas vaginalis (strain ATCC PRA-98 / G3) TaxID=412133 RepID=A2FPF2_TRIV3|nr:protein serine/threonine kinase protein [Trichomonas vaginalis G3]EAX93225.1 AGC family protein kinase [Trichomonas vaginalis G3]KAI5539463.1 protein serine/threonine kinase protein [Trichomonas vaginalis G3]|eukprot:XP_001306155.1 AGC family protein kinase [Trichomonas vaginalis G3]
MNKQVDLDEELTAPFIKKGTKFGFWHKRYCVLRLKEQKLLLYLNKERKIFDRMVKITPEIECLIDENRKHPSFTLKYPDSRPLRLSTPDISTLRIWVNAIRTMSIENQQLSMDDFIPINVIGRGYYGKVTLCEKKSTGQRYAIKSVHKSRLMKAHKAITVINERNTLMKTDHPFIVHIYFAFQNSSKVYMGFEYVAGGDMAFHLHNLKKFEKHDVRLYIAELALAIEYIHRNNIIYRDLKPENILMDETGSVKLTDFGLVKDIAYSKGAHSFCGTPEYLAPEIIKSQKYGPKIDWWALGIVMYSFLYGQTPWYDDNMDKLFKKIISAPLEFPPDATSDEKDLIKNLLDRNPETRKDIRFLLHHPFFNGIKFKDILQRNIPHHYKPDIIQLGAPSNFDHELLDEPILESLATPIHEESDAFTGFSFDCEASDYYEEESQKENTKYRPLTFDDI